MLEENCFNKKVYYTATNREVRTFDQPLSPSGKSLKVSDYYGENNFDLRTAKGIPKEILDEVLRENQGGKNNFKKEHIEVIAKAVTDWATLKGVTHFCHWFQPLTGVTAEKHDSFLNIKNRKPFEKISASQLMQGEPDASSFPNGGCRSTFEARGYTVWDISSPMHIFDHQNGRTLCIPTAFVAYNGEALDMKTPLLRSLVQLNIAATKFLNLIGKSSVNSVKVTCGAEQEYFLIDKSYVLARPDLNMAGRTLVGSLSAKNQQLNDHYFGDIPTRVMSFMHELDYQLYRNGIPSKTRHNEVAPAQFEIAPIYDDANIASDQNQLLMTMIKKIAQRHNFEAILHEKPFQQLMVRVSI